MNDGGCAVRSSCDARIGGGVFDDIEDHDAG